MGEGSCWTSENNPKSFIEDESRNLGYTSLKRVGQLTAGHVNSGTPSCLGFRSKGRLCQGESCLMGVQTALDVSKD